jgi:hypothetical protein
MSKGKNKSSEKRTSIRIEGDDARLLKAIRARVLNRPGVGNVRAGEIVSMALRLVGDAQVRELQERAMTAKHKKEQLRQKYVSVRGPISAKDFDDFMMTPAYAEFLLEQHRRESAQPVSA